MAPSLIVTPGGRGITVRPAPISIPIPASAIPPRARGAIRTQTLPGFPPDSSRVSTIQVEKVVMLPRRPVPSTSPASGWSPPVSMRAQDHPEREGANQIDHSSAGSPPEATGEPDRHQPPDARADPTGQGNADDHHAMPRLRATVATHRPVSTLPTT